LGRGHPWRIGSLSTGRLFVDFANSELYDGRGKLRDRLREPVWREAFLKECGLERYGPIDETGLGQLTDLRSTIRSIAERLYAGRAPTRRSLDTLNSVLAAHPVRFRLSAHGTKADLDVVPLAERGPHVIAGQIALSAARFLAGDEVGRLKMCRNPGCRWIFHDDTKNQSRQWCGPCGNIDKVRRFRERHAASDPGPSQRRSRKSGPRP
jgi:predicted RNA-binding Zn ribbon-like protein